MNIDEIIVFLEAAQTSPLPAITEFGAFTELCKRTVNTLKLLSKNETALINRIARLEDDMRIKDGTMSVMINTLNQVRFALERKEDAEALGMIRKTTGSE